MLSAWVPAVHRSHWGYWLPGTWGLWRPRKLSAHSSSCCWGKGDPGSLLPNYLKRLWGHSAANTGCSPHLGFWAVRLYNESYKGERGRKRVSKAPMSFSDSSSPTDCVSGTCNSSVRKCKETTLGQNTITILPSMEAVLKHGDLTLLHMAMAAGSICGPLSESGQSHFLPPGDLSYEVVRCQAGKFKHWVT